MVTIVTIPRATMNFEHHPWAAAVVVLNVLAVANIPRTVSGRKSRFKRSFATVEYDNRCAGLSVWHGALAEPRYCQQQRGEQPDDL